MADQAHDFALARIDRALARIEAAAARRPAGGDPQLVERHARLRARVEKAIAALDEISAIDADPPEPDTPEDSD
jgi:hypothetical protein